MRVENVEHRVPPPMWWRCGSPICLTLACFSKQILDREVALARVVAEAKDPGAIGHLGKLLRHRGQGRPGRWADEDSFFAGCPPGVVEPVLILDLNHPIQDSAMQVLRHEARADALERVGARRA